MRARAPILAAACLLALPSTAVAGKVLSFHNAREVTEAVAQLTCVDEPACDEFEVTSCRRQAIKRIRCAAVTRDVDGASPQTCVRLVLVRLKIDGDRTSHSVGEPVCRPAR